MPKQVSGTPQGALIERAYQLLRESILSKQFSRNQKLVYSDLEKRLGMSKTPIVAALDRLVQEGYVWHRKNYGYYTNDIHDHHGDAARGFGPQTPSGTERLTPPGDITGAEPPRASLDDSVHDRIKRLILSRDLAPGQKLIYGDLEARLEVSKTPIMSALARLKDVGLVYVKPNAGYYVKEIDFSEMFHLFQARRAIEIANIPFIIHSCTDEDLATLETIHDEYTRYHRPLLDNARMQINNRFHLAIAEMGRNSFMIKYIKEIYDWMELRMPLTFEFLPAERLEQIPLEHEEILEAIRARDRAALGAAFKKHLKAPIKDFAGYLNMKRPSRTGGSPQAS